MDYRGEIDGLRAVAVLAVVLFHFEVAGFQGGFVGVDVFFVISGFLISNIIYREYRETQKFSFANFYYRRVRRLLPALFCTQLLVILLAFLLFTPTKLERLGGALIHSSLSLSNIFFWTEDSYFALSADSKPLLHTWSLSVEEQYYLFWPLCFFLILKLCRKKRHVLSWVAIIGALSFVFNIVLTSSIAQNLLRELLEIEAKATIFYLLPFRVFEFLIGASLLFVPSVKKGRMDSIFFILGISLILYAVFAFDSDMLFPSYRGLVPCLGTAFIIWAGNPKRFGKILDNKAMIFVGKMSYSLYLVHWPLYVFYKSLFVDITSKDIFALVIVSFVVAYGLYRLIESPLRYTKIASSRAATALAYTAPSLIFLYLGGLIWAQEGWKWRVFSNDGVYHTILTNLNSYHRTHYGGRGYSYNSWVGANPSSKIDFLLLGDSHALHLAKGLDEVLVKPKKATVYMTGLSCLILPGLYRKVPDFKKQCVDALEDAITKVSRYPNATLIISHSWKSQLARAYKLDTGAKAGDKNYQLLVAKIKELKSLIPNNKIIVVGAVPTLYHARANVECYSLPWGLNANCDSLVNTDRDSGGGVPVNAMFRQLADEEEGIFYIDPYDVFCSAKRCKAIIDGQPVYSDRGHLSLWGSTLFAKHFAKKLENIQKISKNSSSRSSKPRKEK